jgi:acetyltransferase-like isoleucine patch superfamily enzyme
MYLQNQQKIIDCDIHNLEHLQIILNIMHWSACLNMSQLVMLVAFGVCTIIGGRAFVGHNTTIGSLCHITATSVLGSHIQIGNVVTIGLHASVIEFVKIGNYARIAAGALVVRDVPASQIWEGLPARYLRQVRQD